MNNNIDLDEYARWLPVIGTKEMEDAHLPAPFVERLKRIKAIYDYWVQFPGKKNTDIVVFAEQMFGIKRTQAYQDIRLVQLLVGQNEASSKQFYRWKIRNMIEKAYDAAMRAGDFRSVQGLIKDYILNEQTDKPDPAELDFERIVPMKFYMSDDIGIVMPGKIKTPRKSIEKMLNKYGINSKITDAEYVEVKDDEQREQQ